MTDANLNNPFETSEQVNYLEEVKKKFANETGELDIEKLARGKYEADEFIKRVTAENEELRRKAEQGMALEDFYKKVREGSPSNDGGHPNVNSQDPTPASPEDIEKMIRDTLAKAEYERKVKTNAELLQTKVKEVWGDNAANELRKIASNAGITVKELEELGLKSPAAFFRLAGIDGNSLPSGTVAPTGGHNIRGDSSGVRNQAYYSKLYRENPKLRYDSKIAAQEHADAIKLGEAFFN